VGVGEGPGARAEPPQPANTKLGSQSAEEAASHLRDRFTRAECHG